MASSARPDPTQGGSGTPPLWEIVKWVGIPLILLAAAWGRTQYQMNDVVKREEILKMQQAQGVILEQNVEISNRLKRLTCRLYPQSYECPEGARTGDNPSDIPAVTLPSAADTPMPRTRR